MPRRPDEEGASPTEPEDASEDRDSRPSDAEGEILIPHKSKKTGRLFIIRRTRERDQYETEQPEEKSPDLDG